MTQKARTLEHYLDLHMMKLGIDKCKRFGNPAVRTRRLHSVINQSRSYILVYRVLSMKNIAVARMYRPGSEGSRQ